MIDTGTSQILLSAKFHNFTVSGLFLIHKNKRVQFFMKHGVHFNLAFSQCSTSIYHAIDRQTEFLWVFNLILQFLSYSQNSRKFDACKK